MGMEPREDLVRVLSDRAVRVPDDFTPHHVANVLWAFATMGMEPREDLVRVVSGPSMTRKTALLQQS